MTQGQNGVAHFRASNISYPSRSLEFLDRIPQEEAAAAAAAAPTTNGHHDHDHAAEPKVLRILIVGAGLGGLSSAIALSLQGHSVRVLEQAREIGEIGAGIQIPSNSSRILRSWGVTKFLQDRVVKPDSVTFRRWENGTPIAFTPYQPDFEDEYGAPYLVIHRAHFHDALHQRAVELGVEITTDAKVVEYDAEAPAVVLESGKRIGADLVVAADGIKSIAHDYLGHGLKNGAYQTGFAAYRATVETKKMKENPEIAWLIEKPSLNVWIGHDKHVMTYMISSGEAFNLVLSHVDRTDPKTWTTETAIEDMRQQFRDWDPRLVKIINMIEKTLKWPLMSMTPCQKWVSKSGKMTILGDAAHAMLPYMSQGAAMAVEDAAALATAISHITPTSFPLSKALTLYETIRSLRTSQMQQASLVNGKLWHLADGPEQEARDQATRAEVDGGKFGVSANQWSDPVTQRWTYGYDAVGEVERVFW